MATGRLFTAAFVLSALSACSSMHPSPVESPTQAQLTKASKDALAAPTTPSEAAIRVHQLSIYYKKRSDKLKKSDNWAKEGVFAGSLIAAAAGIAESASVAAAGIVLAGGSSIVSQHYAYDVQSTNYKSASRALSCMFLPLWNAALLQYSFDIARVNTQITSVVHRLEDAQDSIELATPDVSSLKTSLQSQTTAEDAAADSGADTVAQVALSGLTLPDQGANVQFLQGASSVTMKKLTVRFTPKQQNDMAVNLYADINVCADTF